MTMNPKLTGKNTFFDAEWWLDVYVEEFEKDPDYIAQTLALQITEQAIELMQESNVSRTKLAELMGVSKAYVTRLLNAPPNLTLRSIAQLALVLGTKPHASLLPACPVGSVAWDRQPWSASQPLPANVLRFVPPDEYERTG
jgi:hypothetical protein